MNLRLITCATVLLLQAAWLPAADPAAVAAARPTDDDLQIPGVFNSVPPRTERKHALRFVVHPHLGDITKRDHLRTALGFRCGITTRWEASTEAAPTSPTG